MSRYALIADPDPRRAAEYASLLAEPGLEVVLAHDGAQAQQVLRQRGPPALLVTELALPSVDGFTLLAGLREHLPCPTTVLVVTAFDELRLMAWPHRARLGIHAFLEPHAPRESVRDTLRDALQGRLPREPSPQPRAPQRPVPASPQGPAPELAQVVAAAAQAFGVPVALLFLGEAEGAPGHTVAHVTLPRRPDDEVLDWAPFHRAVRASRGMVVTDLTRDALLREEPLVREGVLGSFAGAPLLTPAGARLGTLCLLDSRRRALGPEELGVLAGLARRIAGELESQARARAAEQEALRLRGALGSGLEYLREALLAVDAGVLLVDGEGRALVANARLCELLGMAPGQLERMSLDEVRRHLVACAVDPQAVLRQLEPSSGPSATLAVTLELARPQPRVLRWVARPISIPGGQGQLSTFTPSTGGPSEE